MEKHELEIEILPDGKVRVEVHGAKGTECLEYAEMMEKLVGLLESKQLTAEYYEPPAKVRIHQPQKIREKPAESP